MKPLQPIFFFTALILIVGLACSGGSVPPTQAPPPTQPVQMIPTQPPPPTEVPPTEPPATEVATEPPAPQSQQFFTEEFDQDPGWDYFLTFGDKDKITTEFKNSLMVFDLEDTGIYAYYLYDQNTYDNVRLDMRAENRGKNNNNVSLICRASTDGWYEFSTEGGGLWYLYAVTVNSANEAVYKRIANGGAQPLKQGKEVNDYGMICQDNEITLIINDKEIKKVEEKDYAFRDGQVGFNISSLNVYPIVVEVDWFKISEP